MIYLMRHLHAADARVPGVVPATAAWPGPTAVNTIAVLSRADEIGGGRVDAMFAARGIAQRYRARPDGARAVPERGRGGRADRRDRPHAAPVRVRGAGRRWPASRRPSWSRSCARWTGSCREPGPGRSGGQLLAALRDLRHPAVHQPDPAGREQPGRAGRRAGRAQRPAASCSAVLHTQFSERRDLLKARSALLAVDSVLRTTGRGRRAAGRRSSGSWPARTSSPSCGCSRALRAGPVGLPTGGRRRGRAAARRRRGGAPPTGSGWPADADAASELRQAAFAALDRWQRHAVNPMFGRATADACRVVVRSCEGVLAGLHRAEPARPGAVPTG